ncbi:rhomboid family intramembrane serine protease [Streptomyces physcomitrii]|uniref:Rhomboid family intramembrane serine protease n=1 Tax=Streptomyces physcomitrii TaxID=2724184 RepID=A0ABX1H1C1_9ACTN|nr:rhomboid family intramembrane serine protease [Streptomyces physcomitrii]NKI41084.1 rhomboid family intramembrane serine protease [Streptomyces physcomitrii]
MDQPSGGRQAQGELPGCYRHPDRETGVRCVRCDRPICPECMVSASVGFQCPDCVRAANTGPGASAARPRTLAGGSVAADPRLVTKVLLALNLFMFVAVHVGDTVLAHTALLGGWPPPQYFPSGGYAPTEGVASGEWYRLLTSMFVHEQPWHLAFNLLGLWWLGAPLEAALGRARYLALYLLSGLAGSALTYVLVAPQDVSYGASGAVFGLLGATAVLMRRLRYDMRPVILLLGLNLVFTFTMSNIAWQAHIGGLVAGAALAYAMVHAPAERRSLVQWGSSALLLAVLVATVLVRTAVLL